MLTHTLRIHFNKRQSENERTSELANALKMRENREDRERQRKYTKDMHNHELSLMGQGYFRSVALFSSVLIICFPLFRLIFPVENITVIHRMQCPRASYRLLHKKKTSKAESKTENIKKHTQKRCCDYCCYSYCCNDRPIDRRTNMFHLLLNFRRTMIRRF